MKKLLLFLSIVVVIILKMNFKAQASEYYFKWENTNLKVPLNADISEYIFKPKATLYFNGEYVEEQEISYMRGGFDGLTNISDIDTTTVGIYKVVYYACDYMLNIGYCDKSEETIVFDVCDEEPPVINLTKSRVIFNYNVESFNFDDLVSVSDNVEVAKYNIDTSNVKYKVLGEYEVYINAYDIYSNAAKEEIIRVNIIDDVSPDLRCSKSSNYIKIKYDKNKEINISDYFKAVDEYDGDISSNIEFSGDIKKETGIYELNATVLDSSNNKSSLDFKVEIYDDEAPVINMKSYYVECDINEVEEIDLKSYIDSVSDNMDDPTIDDVLVLGELTKSEEVHEITYVLTDKRDNECRVKVNFLVKNYEEPKVKFENKTININEEFNLADNIEILEDDEYIKKSLKIIDSNLNIYEEGTYYISFSLNNRSGVYTYKNMIIKVVNPNVLKVDEDNVEKEGTFDKKYIYIAGVIIIGIVLFYIRKKK